MIFIVIIFIIQYILLLIKQCALQISICYFILLSNLRTFVDNLTYYSKNNDFRYCPYNNMCYFRIQ